MSHWGLESTVIWTLNSHCSSTFDFPTSSSTSLPSSCWGAVTVWFPSSCSARRAAFCSRIGGPEWPLVPRPSDLPLVGLVGESTSSWKLRVDWDPFSAAAALCQHHFSGVGRVQFPSPSRCQKPFLSSPVSRSPGDGRHGGSAPLPEAFSSEG